jgi:Molecular chaperone GrpE (heat shock protein)
MSKKKNEPVSEENISEQAAVEGTIPTEVNPLDELNEKYLRLAAEYDNFRKRTAAEKSALRGLVVADTVSQFLNVLDNLERAAAHAEGDVKAGLDMTIASFAGALTGLGVTEVGATDAAFDPDTMQAVSGEGDVVDVVLQKGYVMDGRVVRIAMVVVKEANVAVGNS